MSKRITMDYPPNKVFTSTVPKGENIKVISFLESDLSKAIARPRAGTAKTKLNTQDS